ncbi:MAG: hypothetical protein MHM6MM_004543 [Cercozoa sp. M6MM]
MPSDVPARLSSQSPMERVFAVYDAIQEGARSFLSAELKYMTLFVVVFGVIIAVVIGLSTQSIERALGVACAFAVGSGTSMLAGYIGMRVAVFSNGRTALESKHSLARGFQLGFQGGGTMGFTLVSMALLSLTGVTLLYLGVLSSHTSFDTKTIMTIIAGFGMGASSVALFKRVGGGIYTKAADVGADLVGKVEAGIPEDDPRNPATIADNVGDNVGDIAGMGADLFGSFAGSTCAAQVLIADTSIGASWHMGGLLFPLAVSGVGLFSCALVSPLASHFSCVDRPSKIKGVLKAQELFAALVSVPLLALLTYLALPSVIVLEGGNGMQVHRWLLFACVCSGLVCGVLIGMITEWFTSHAYSPVRDVAESCRTGAATNIIYGLALGYKSTVLPAVLVAATLYGCHAMAQFLGVALAALGVLTILATSLSVDAYGPICDNAGGIAEMAFLGQEVRDRTDALDAAGNTTAAIGKGFAIASAALVSLALLGAFVENVRPVPGKPPLHHRSSILHPGVFAGLLFGAMLPYLFSAMTMKSVGSAALAMVEEVRRQLAADPGILEGTSRPDYARCIEISTRASLREMVLPGALVVLTPVVIGFLFGPLVLAGVLAGAVSSGVHMAVSMSNTGGAWDNAKKYIEAGCLLSGTSDEEGGDITCGKGSPEHVAAVTGDTVGDPLKDTSGPALNILMKLMAIIALVFASSFLPAGAGDQFQ